MMMPCEHHSHPYIRSKQQGSQDDRNPLETGIVTRGSAVSALVEEVQAQIAHTSPRDIGMPRRKALESIRHPGVLLTGTYLADREENALKASAMSESESGNIWLANVEEVGPETADGLLQHDLIDQHTVGRPLTGILTYLEQRADHRSVCRT
jgi:predicted aconitase